MLYVGVDAHKATSQITVVNETGSILKRAKVASTSSAFQQALSGYDEPLTAVLEASYCWGPIYDWLDDLTEEVVLAHPSKVRAIAEARIKTDKIDSAILAYLLRADLIPRAYAPSKENSCSEAGSPATAFSGSVKHDGEKSYPGSFVSA